MPNSYLDDNQPFDDRHAGPMCRKAHPDAVPGSVGCILAQGHAGWHKDLDSRTWFESVATVTMGAAAYTGEAFLAQPMNPGTCPAFTSTTGGRIYCVKGLGHTDSHRNSAGYAWANYCGAPHLQYGPCTEKPGHTGWHRAGGNGTWSGKPAPAGPFTRPAEPATAGEKLLHALQDQMVHGTLQNRAGSPFRSDGVKIIYHNGVSNQTVALAVTEDWARKIAGQTSMDPLYVGELNRLRANAEHWRKQAQRDQVGEIVAEHAREMTDVRGRHIRATKHVARLTHQLAERDQALKDRAAEIRQLRERARSWELHATNRQDRDHWKNTAYTRGNEINRLNIMISAAQAAERSNRARFVDNANALRRALKWPSSSVDPDRYPEAAWPALSEMIQVALEKLGADSADKAQLERHRARWMNLHGQLSGDALHLLRRMNTLAGEHDAAEFTRAGADATMDKVLELRKADTLRNVQLEERVTELEEHLTASRAAAEVDRKRFEELRMNSGCPHLSPLNDMDSVTMLELRKCVRVNKHDGAHIRKDGSAW
jgi:hypothetical protein